jgi:hypothetical protein
LHLLCPGVLLPIDLSVIPVVAEAPPIAPARNGCVVCSATSRKRIESEGIKYVFFQQVSVTGRVMGKGVVAAFFPQVAEKGYQLVYGAT